MTRRISILSALILCLGPSLARAQNSVVFTTNTTIGIGDTTHDGKDVIVRGCTVTIDGPHTFTSIRIEHNGGTAGSVTHSQGSTAGMNLTILGDVEVQSGNSINVSGRGFAPGQGPGRGWSDPVGYGSGGSHGGSGGSSSYGAVVEGTYGSYASPNQLGSGGGGTNSSGYGGGFVRLTIGGDLVVQGGIYADGSYGWAGGGGSGGSIWIQADTVSGGGLIRAAGGGTNDGNNGSGGGGRVAIFTSTAIANTSVYAMGWNIGYYGGAGTAYTKTAASTRGLLRFDNAFTAGGRTVVESETIPDNVLIVTNTYLTHRLGVPDFTWTVEGDLTTQPYSGFDVSMRGSAPQKGEGRGFIDTNNRGSGASCAGYGGGTAWGAEVSVPFGSYTTPTELGSGGGGASGGRGGGRLRLGVNGSLLHDGVFYANGGSGFNGAGANGGGGAGGSIWITAGHIVGIGLIEARGGSNQDGNAGSGSGGRIAISATTSAFQGQVRAPGGTSGYYGGAGTVWIEEALLGRRRLIIDNTGPGAGRTPLPSGTINGDLVITGGGSLTSFWQTPLSLVVNGSIEVSSSSQIDLTARGWDHGGPGVGQLDVNNRGSGGSYGGRGGRTGWSEYRAPVYGSEAQPADMGSAGGGLFGEPGGGALKLTSSGPMVINGSVRANGGFGYNSCGGGSGGSIWLTAPQLLGNGLVEANGGVLNDGNAGSGGGGRIAIYGDRASFVGTIRALGGNGGNVGENGTVYFGSLGSSISGIVALEGFSGTSGPTTVTFEFRLPGTSTIVDTKTVPLAADGSYTVIAPGSGQYDISTKVANWLRRTRNVNMASGNITAFHFSLLNGDCDDDNEVGIGDYSLISGAFGTAIGDSGYDPAADIDWDGEVGIGDYSLLSANFGMTGDE